MSRKREAIFMGIGILAGLTLSGPAAQAATTITATLSNHPIYVDGQQVPMTAYSIGGNNYVRLRDIGKAVNFGVTYDADANSVHIDSTQPYREDTLQATQSMPNLSLTEEMSQLRSWDCGTSTRPTRPMAPPTAPTTLWTVPTATATPVRAGP